MARKTVRQRPKGYAASRDIYAVAEHCGCAIQFAAVHIRGRSVIGDGESHFDADAIESLLREARVKAATSKDELTRRLAEALEALWQERRTMGDRLSRSVADTPDYATPSDHYVG